MPDNKELLNKISSLTDTDIQEARQKTSEFFPTQSQPESLVKQTTSQYDTGFLIPEKNKLSALEEHRAQQQSRLDRWANAVPRLASKITTEILKTPGYLYSGIEALGDKTLAETVNNSYLNKLQSLDDVTKEKFAIYTPQSVKDGNLWDNVTSASFWTNEGVDGAGFLIAMLAPGAGLKALGLTGKASSIASKLGAGASKAISIGNKVELGSATAMNTTLESMAETKELVDNLKVEFDSKIKNGEINPKTNQPWTPEDAKTAIGDAAVSSFTLNMALLVGPDFLMNKNLLGRFNPTKKTLDNIVDNTGKLVPIDKLTKKQILTDYAKNIGLNTFSEGFVEEAGQFTIEDYNKKLALGKTDKGLLEGLGESYADALTSNEGQKSIFLGGFLGSLSSIAGGSNLKKENEASSKLYDILKTNFEGFSKGLEDIYVKKKDGSLLLQNDKPVINQSKLAELAANIAMESKSSKMKDVYGMLGNKEAYNYIENQELARLAFPYLGQEGGKEALNKHIDLLSNQMVENKKQVEGVDSTFDELKYKADTKQKIDKLQQVYDSVDDTIRNIDLNIDETNKHLEGEFLNKLQNAVFQESVKQLYLADRIQDLNSQVLNNEISTTKDLPQVKEDTKKLKNQIDKYNKAQEESIDKYQALFDKKEQQKAFDEYSKDELAKVPIVEEKPVETPTEVLSKEAITDEDFNNFTNTGEVKPEHLELIADKQQSKLPLTEREQAVYTAKSKEIENILKQRVIEDKKKSTIHEDTEHQAKEGVVEEDRALAETPFKSAGRHYLEDNKTVNSDLNQQKWFNYLQTPINPGYKLLTVTPNNPELFNSLVSEDAYKIGGSKFEPGIFVVIVDENNKPVEVDSKPVFTTLEKTIDKDRLSAIRRAKTEGIEVKEAEELIDREIKQLAELRKEILASKDILYLTGLRQEFGPRQVERNGTDRVKGSPKGRITNDIKHLTLEVGKSTTSKFALLSNGVKVYSGKLYVIDRTTNRTYDLTARTLNESEVNLAFKLIENLVNGKSSGTKENPKTILENLIYLRADNPNELYKIDLVKDGKKTNLLIGDTTFTTIDESNTQLIKDFLATKFIQFNANINPDEKYTEYKIDSEGKIFTKEWNSYKEYITDNDDIPFSTDVAKIEEGKPRFINPYLTYNPKPIIATIKESELEERKDDINPFEDYETQPEEGVVPKEPKKFTKREVKIDESTLNRLALDKIGKLITKEEKQWFKDATGLDYEEVDGLIQDKALGQVTKAGKVLLSIEATEGTLKHEAFHIITQFVLSPKQVDNLYKEAREKFPKKSDAEIEEILAEDFIDYTITGKVLGERPKRNTLFRKLLNLLKKLVGIDTTTIEEVYSKLYKGQYKNAKKLGTKRLLKNTSLSRTKALQQNYVYDKAVIDGVTAMFTDVLIENGKTPTDLLKYKNLTNLVQDKVYDKLIELYEAGNNDLEWVIINWDNLIVPRLNEKLASFNLKYSNKVKKNIEVDVEGELTSVNTDEEETTTEGKRSGDGFAEANQKSSKDTMNGTTKWLIASLPQVDKEGKRVNNELGLPELVDFNKTYGQLLNELTGLNTFEEMYTKLQVLSLNKPNYIELLNRIKAPSAITSLEETLQQVQFRQDFAKNKTESYITKIEADGNIYTISANKSGLEEKIKTKWQYNMRGASKYIVEKDGKLIVDKDVTKIDNPINFLKALGITFGNDTFKYLRDNKFAIPALNNAVNYIKQEIEASEDGIIDLYSKDSNVTGRMNDLAELEGEYSDETIEHSFQSVEGKTIYEIGLNNFLTLSKNIINNATNRDELFSKLPHLNTIYNQNSLWLKSMFTENGERRVISGKPVILNVDLLNGLKSGDDGLPTAKLTTGDKIVQEINNTLLAGKTAYLRAADAASEHSISLSQFPSNRTDKKVLPVTIDSVDKGFDTPEIKKIFTGYLIDEVNAIRAFNTQGLGKDIDVYNKKGGQFRVFDGILTSSRSKVEALLNDEVGTPIPQEILDSANKDVIKFLDTYYSETVKFIDDNKADYISLKLTDKYNKTQLIRAFVVNDFISSVEQVKLFTGDLGFYKDFYKRTKGLAGTKKFAENSSSLNVKLNKLFIRQDGKTSDGNINVAVFNDSTQSSNYLKEYTDILVAKGFTKEEAESILEPYTKMDEGDAQGWITLDEWREFMFRVGDIKPKQLALLDKIQKGTELTKEDIYTIQTLKAQYFGPQVKNNLFAPAYHKFSLMPLIPSLIKGTNLEKLNDTLKKQQVGYALFKSGSKVGTPVNSKGKANNFYTEETHGDITSNIDMIQRVPYEYLGIQVDISPDLKDKVIFGTQFRKLILSNIFENGVANSPKFKSLVEEYNDLIAQYTHRKEQGLREKLGIKGSDYSHKDIFKLVETLQKEAEDRNLPDNLIDALQAQIVEGKEMLKYPIDALVTKPKVEAMLMSLINSNIIRQKVSGDAMIQGASSGFEKLGTRVKGSNELKFYTPGQPMEIKVPFSSHYKPLLAKYGTVEAINKAIKDGSIDKRLVELVGYRIPTQGLNSIEYMTIAEFLPEESGNLIVLPTEIVAKSGGDYDIDKLNVIRPSIYKEGNYEEYSGEKASNDQIINRLLEISKDIISDEDNFVSLITPNSVNNTKRLVQEIRELKGEAKEPNVKSQTELLKFKYKVEQFNNFLSGKAGVGIAAVQNTNHIIYQLSGAKVAKQYIDNIYMEIKNKDKDGNASLGNITNISGVKISDLVSEFINAYVDIAKDPFVFDLNATTEAAGVWLYLTRLGADFDTIAYFMNQPIITEYLKAKSVNNSLVVKNSGNYLQKKQLFEKVVRKYEPDNQKGKDRISDNLVLGTKDNELLKSYIKNPNQNSLEFNRNQVQFLYNYLEYSDQSRLMSEVAQALNMDTAGVGKNLDSSEDKKNLFTKVDATNFISNWRDVFNTTFLKAFDKHDFSIKAYNDLFFSSRPDINIYLRDVIDSVPTFKTIDKDKVTSLVRNDFISYLLQNYGTSQGKLLNEYKDILFKGENSLAKRLIKLRQKENKTPQEQEILDNKFVKELFPLLNQGFEKTDNIKIFTKRLDTFTYNLFTEEFRKLKDISPDTYNNLVRLGILQSGLNNSPITYLGLIPYEAYGDLVNDAIDNFDKKNGVNDLYKFKQLFYRNNYKGILTGFGGRSNEYSKFDKKSNQWDIGTNLGNYMFGKDYSLDKYIPNDVDTVNDSKHKDIVKAKKGVLVERLEKLGYSEDEAFDKSEEIANLQKEGLISKRTVDGTYRIPAVEVINSRGIKEYKKNFKAFRALNDYLELNKIDWITVKEVKHENQPFIVEFVKQAPIQEEIDFNVVEGDTTQEDNTPSTVEDLQMVEKNIIFANKVQPWINTLENVTDYQEYLEANGYNVDDIIQELKDAKTDEDLAKVIKKICG